MNRNTLSKTTEEQITITALEAAAKEIEGMKARSAWRRGVKVYALDLIEEMENNAEYTPISPDSDINKIMLNGAESWSQYSWGGGACIYDEEIARLLCSPSELKRTNNGQRRLNSREEWLDTQASALCQAARLVRNTVKRHITELYEISAQEELNDVLTASKQANTITA